MALAETMLQILGTLLVATVFYTVTLHLAATYVLKEASALDALLVGPVPAVLSVGGGLLAQSAGSELATLAIPLVAIPADFLAIGWSYELHRRMAALVTLGHFVVSIVLVTSLLGLTGGL